jgi:hypothetical protein
MILRQPIPQRRRQQKRLLTITIPKVLTHPGIQLNPPDRPLYATASRDRKRPASPGLTLAFAGSTMSGRSHCANSKRELCEPSQMPIVHSNDPTPAAALPVGTTKGGLGRLELTIAIVAKRSSGAGTEQ